TLMQLAQANLRKRLIDEGEKIWRKSNTGIHYIQGLDELTASVILLTDVIDMLDIPDGDPVSVIPTSDLCIIGGSQNVKQLCIMGEVALKLSKKEQFISTQPLRLVEKQWILYKANKANVEHPLPRTPDEFKMLKRAFKMQGK
ncbi:hypothetical protein, partial [Salmonella sp. s54925]|uniref:hypothetical protein n=1 Tax=Salmonella sp. s54925 TaxID=3159674 RepID=UPI00398035F0